MASAHGPALVANMRIAGLVAAGTGGDMAIGEWRQARVASAV